MDSIPIVVLTGQVPTSVIGNDAFQEADIIGITRPCTKHSFLVKEVSDLAQTIKEAFYIAGTGNPGPVVVDMPKDVLGGLADFHYPENVNLPGYKPNYNGHIGQIKKALQYMEKAKRPVMYCGGGVIASDASKEVLQLAEAANMPVTCTLMGLGGFPGTHEHSLGMLGMHGTYWANLAMDSADLLIAIGARFDDRITGKLEEFAVHAKIIHIDIDPSCIGKNVPTQVPIVGDAKQVLGSLLPLVTASKRKWKEDLQAWHDQIAGWKKEHPLGYEQGTDGPLCAQYVIEEFYRATNGNAIITTEVGQHQMWAAQFYLFDEPRRFISSGGLGTMGYGFPAAIGAQFACPDATVIDIAGDGSFQMMTQELATAVQYKIPVIVAVMNNSTLGMVRQWQELFFKRRYSEVDLSVSPDYVKLAEAYGAVGLRATKMEEVGPVIQEALKSKKPVVIDFVIRTEENVYPMIPAGNAIREMLLA